MFARKILHLLCALSACTSTILAQTTVLDYSGRISVDGTPFNGGGAFVFSIQETNGVIWWSSSPLPLEGTTNLPARVVKLPVKDGVYSVRLGDSQAGMPPLDLDTLRRAYSPRLRVWFNDGTNGWARAGEDRRLADALTSAWKSAPMTSAQAETLMRELRDVRSLFERSPPATPPPAPPPAPTATVSIKDCPSLGRTNAPLVLVEFVDFECPFCKQAHQTALPELKKKYVDTGQLRFVTRNLALPFHPQAETAARAALCALKQQQFWPMHDKMLTLTSPLSTTNLLKAAAELDLDVPAFAACLETAAVIDAIKQDNRDAQAVGIIGTPTFVLGKAVDDRVTGVVLIGAQTAGFFETEIRKQLGAE